MSSDIFISIKNGCYGEYYDYSDNHCSDDVMKKLSDKKMLDHPERMIDYINKFGYFELYRTECHSGDEIRFYSNPLGSEPLYWTEYQCTTAAYIGGFKNCSCNNTWIEQFYMNSDGKIFNQNKKQIAENPEDFWAYITTVEYDFHPTISDETYKLLTLSGWYEGRTHNIKELVDECRLNNVLLNEAQIRFIKEFGGLKGQIDDNYNKYFYISDTRKLKKYDNEPIYYVNILKDKNLFNQLDMEEIEEIIDKYGKNTICVGNCYYYLDPILLTESGNMLIVNSGEVKPIGRTAMEGFNYLLGN